MYIYLKPLLFESEVLVMQKRTRIFAVVTVLAGLLLGLGAFLFAFAPAVPAEAGHQKHHKVQHKVVKVVQQLPPQTVTTTTTTTTTTTPPGPPPPLCFAFPNPATIGTGVAAGNPAGNVQFIEQCHNLTPTDTYTITWNFTTCIGGVGVVTVDGLGFGGVIGTSAPFVIFPDKFGDLNANFQFSLCKPGSGTVTVTDNRTGQAFITSVTLQ
jgi:hypothetical protein